MGAWLDGDDNALLDRDGGDFMFEDEEGTLDDDDNAADVGDFDFMSEDEEGGAALREAHAVVAGEEGDVPVCQR